MSSFCASCNQGVKKVLKDNVILKKVGIWQVFDKLGTLIVENEAI